MILGQLQGSNLVPTLFCRDLQDRLDALQTGLDAANAAGISGPAVANAQAYVDKQTGFFSRDLILTGDACTAQVSYAQGLLDALNAVLPTPVQVPQTSPGGSGNPLGLPGWALPVGVALIALLVVSNTVGIFKK